MRPYNTQQRQALLSYLREHAEGLLSAEELWEGMQGERKISLSAVYRNLNMLAIDGSVRKLLGNDGKTMRYQYVDHDRCDAHLHLKCSRCGRLIHISEETSDTVLRSIANSGGFTVDMRKTILYGLCGSCK